MRRFSYLSRLILSLFAIGYSSMAMADLQRSPEVAPLAPTQAELADQASVANFKTFYNALREANRPLLEGAENSTQITLRQRPEKIMRTSWDPSKNLFVIVPNFNGMNSYMDAYYGQVDVETGTTTRIYRNSVFTNAEEAYIQTGVIREGIAYIPKINFDMVTMDATVEWKRFDILTGQVLPSLQFGGSAAALKMFVYAMAYDPVHDVIYALTYDNATGLGGGLIKVDCSKPENEWKAESFYDSNKTEFNVGGSAADWMAGICFDPLSQTLYGLATTGKLYEIDTENCQRILLREYDYSDEDFCFPPVMQSTPMVYSPKDKSIILITFNNNSGISNIVSLDSAEDSWDAYFLNDFRTQMMAATLYCPDPFAVDDAPGIMDVPVLDFQPGKTTGKISVTAPMTYYNEVAMEPSTKMNLHVLANNTEVYTKEVTPGEKVDFTTTLSQGLNDIVVYCSLGDLKGAESKTRLYIGYDTPKAPTGLAYKNGILTWRTPASTGIHNSYLDLSDVTYDVYLDGVKHNTAPITGNSYELIYNDQADGRKYMTVTATSHDETSAPSEALSRVLGKGYALPLTIAPTYAESTLFETYNLNRGVSGWTFNQTTSGKGMFTTHTQEYTDKPNDWLIFPPLYFDSAEGVYEFAMTYVNARRNDIQKDNMEIYLGKDAIPEAMTELIYSHYGRIQPTETDLSVKFSVPEAGTYFIGIYCKPGDENLYRGIDVSNFRIKKSSSSTRCPGIVSDVKLTAYEYGEPAMTVEAVLPTKDMAGRDLAADQQLSMNMYTNSGTSTVKGTPGQKVKGDVYVGEDGFCDLYIAVANDEGEGTRTYYTTWVGYDIPKAPVITNYTIDPDNLGMVITWEPVGEVGEHNGFVDVDDVRYDFYSQSTTDATKLGTANKETSYHFTVGKGNQSRYHVGPVAVTFMGTSINGQFVTETLGNLYPTPAKEDFGYSAFRLSKWLYDTKLPVTWEHCTEPSAEFAPDGNISFTNGGSFRATGNGTGQLMAPRVTTKNDDKVAFKTRYWNYSNAGKIELWGKTYENQEFRKIAEVVPTRPDRAQWEEWYVALPAEFARQNWIQLNVKVVLSGGQNVLLDTYEVVQDIQSDFQASSIEAPYSAFIGETPTFNVKITNAGSEAARGTLRVELLGDGDVLASCDMDIERVRPGENFETPVDFYIDESCINYDMLEVHAYTEAEGDENPRNNNCYATFYHYDNTLPTVRDLSAARSDDGNNVELKWSTPVSKGDGLESVENYYPLDNTDKIGPWTNVDIDGKEQFTISTKRWTGDTEPSGWIVLNAADLDTKSDPRLSPLSGDQMLLARSVAYDQDTEKPTRSMDFLISPEVKGGTKVGFWLNTLSSTYSETVAIWYSTTDMTLDPESVVLTDRENVPRECGSFKWLRNFTKSGSETWEYCEVMLPENAKYFAFVYSSFGMFGAMIDDITYTPVDPVVLTPDSYDILVAYDNEEPKPVGITLGATEYTHKDVDGRAANYFVQGVYYANERAFVAPLSNPAKIDATGVDSLDGNRYVRGGKGQIVIGNADGVKCIVSELDGKVIANRVLSNNRETITVNQGVYLVQLGNNTVKVIVR